MDGSRPSDEAHVAYNAHITGEVLDGLTEEVILDLIAMRSKKGYALQFEVLVALLYQKRATALEKESVELARKVKTLTVWVVVLTVLVLACTAAQIAFLALTR